MPSCTCVSLSTVIATVFLCCGDIDGGARCCSLKLAGTLTCPRFSVLELGAYCASLLYRCILYTSYKMLLWASEVMTLWRYTNIFIIIIIIIIIIMGRRSKTHLSQPLNKYVHPHNTRMEKYTGCVAYCPPDESRCTTHSIKVRKKTRPTDRHYAYKYTQPA